MVKDLHRNKESGAGLNEWRGGAGIRERGGVISNVGIILLFDFVSSDNLNVIVIIHGEVSDKKKTVLKKVMTLLNSI